ncbi:hypothetical protein ABZP36_023077 [Zizania latifolia]
MAPPPCSFVVSAVRHAVLVVVVVLVLVVSYGPCVEGARPTLREGSAQAWRSPEHGTDDRRGSGSAGVLLHRRTSDDFFPHSGSGGASLPPSGPSERHNARLDSDVADLSQSPPPASP